MPPGSSRKRANVAAGAGGSPSKKTRRVATAGSSVRVQDPRTPAPAAAPPALPAAAAPPDPPVSPEDANSNYNTISTKDLRERFIALFSEPQFEGGGAAAGGGGGGGGGGVSNAALKRRFGDAYTRLVPIINQLTTESRLTMSKGTSTGELYYSLVSDAVASKFSGLDVSARMVYQIIEKAGSMGIWTKDVRLQTNIQQQALTKIFKSLENRRLIKPVKSVTAKAKKLYMLYNLQPSTELTGGVWYSDLEFDHEFIAELRTFLLHCIRRMNGGQGVTLVEIRDKMIQANVSKVQLQPKEVEQLVRTLVYDYLVEEAGTSDSGDPLYVQAKRITTPGSDFKWWDVLAPDFHFRTIRFEDGVTLGPHEAHYHTA